MKKVLILINILIIFSIFNVNALEYQNVFITTTFTEDIEFTDIKKINVEVYGEGIDYVDDSSTVVLLSELTESNNYSSSYNNINIIDKSYIFAMVDGDNLGVYDCEVTLDTSNIDTANITINVSKNNTTKDENVTIPSDIVSKLFPNDSSSEETTTEVVITTTTPTTFEVTTKSQAEKEAEEKKEKSTKKRNNFVSILVYTSIVLIIIIGIIFVTCKFINSNK